MLTLTVATALPGVRSGIDFAKLGSKKAIVQKLKEKAGPEARKLFEKFVRDVEKFQARQERNGG
jgi:hypothetical protein